MTKRIPCGAIALAVALFFVSHAARAGEIHYNAREGILPGVDAILAADPTQIELRDESGSTPLVVAADNGHQNVVERLLAKGANLNARNSRGETALFDAVNRRYTEIATLLISREANVNIGNKEGETPLHLAADMDQAGLVSLLLTNKANPNAKNVLGFTPLHYAIHRDSMPIVEAMLAFKADVTIPIDIAKWAAIRNRSNITHMLRYFHPFYMASPLSLAQYYGHTEIADLLKKKPK